MMKPLLLSAFILTATFTSCKKHDCADGPVQRSTYAFRIDLQEQFESDEVVAYVDGSPVYSGRPVSNHVLGLAEIITDSVNAGPHMLKVVVNNQVAADTTIAVSGDVYIGVSYLPNSGRILFNVSREPFVYY